jgi:hypothetical protein
MSQWGSQTASAAAPTTAPSCGAKNNGFTIIIYAAQFLYGGWFLFHGLNYWFEFYPDRSIQSGPGLVPAMAASGLMAIVKALEIAIGGALLANRFAPLAVVAAWPITFSIAFVTSSHGKPFGIGVAIVIIGLNGLMSLGYLERYRPMLAFNAGHPGLGAAGPWLRPMPVDGPGPSVRLPLALHLWGALGGLGAAVAITYLSLALRS